MHRGMVRGMAGSVQKGKVVSIVVAGGYEDDEDRGDEFTYTGSGGAYTQVLSRNTLD